MNMEDKSKYGYMYQLPDIKNRLIIMNIQLSGKEEKDNIIEICCLEMINGKRTRKKFHSFFRPRNGMTEESKEKHKIPEEVFNYNTKKEKALYKELLDFINDSLIIIHNARDGLEKINNELLYYKLPLINKYQFRCSQRIFFEKYESNSQFLNNKIYECCEYFNIRYIKKNLHSAEYEASLLLKIIQKIHKDQDSNNNSDDDDEMSIENEEMCDKNDMEEMTGKVVKDVVIKKYRIVKNFLNKKRNEK